MRPLSCSVPSHVVTAQILQGIAAEREQLTEKEKAAYRRRASEKKLNRCRDGIKRGLCDQCNGCEGFCASPFGGMHRFAFVCVYCGCESRFHEVIERALA